MIGALHRFDPISKKNSFDQKMVMNLILVFLVCQCNEYVIPKSMSRKDLGYKFTGESIHHTLHGLKHGFTWRMVSPGPGGGQSPVRTV